MKKVVKIDARAEKEFRKFSFEVQSEFKSLIQALSLGGRLELPNGKKIGRSLFEIRVKFGGEYRSIYAYLVSDKVIILHFFKKKTQKTPIKSIKVAERRLRYYDNRY